MPSLPAIYLDEPYGSYLARAARHYHCYDSVEFTRKYLGKTSRPHINTLVGVFEVVKTLEQETGQGDAQKPKNSLERFLRDHSFVPLTLPFTTSRSAELTEKNLQNLSFAHVCYLNAKKHSSHFVKVNWRDGSWMPSVDTEHHYYDYYRFCPKCLEEQEKKGEELHWKREWFLFGVHHCSKHRCLLWQSDLPIIDQSLLADKRIYLPDEIGESRPIDPLPKVPWNSNIFLKAARFLFRKPIRKIDTTEKPGEIPLYKMYGDKRNLILLSREIGEALKPAGQHWLDHNAMDYYQLGTDTTWWRIILNRVPADPNFDFVSWYNLHVCKKTSDNADQKSSSQIKNTLFD